MAGCGTCTSIAAVGKSLRQPLIHLHHADVDDEKIPTVQTPFMSSKGVIFCVAFMVACYTFVALICAAASGNVLPNLAPGARFTRFWQGIPHKTAPLNYAAVKLSPHRTVGSYTPKSKEISDDQRRTRDDSPWNASALQSLRTAFHFQPLNYWMNDPDAPLYYKGWYHLFYQYNPAEAYWGLISWGHTISRDLIHWLYLEPLSLEPDHWYDENGAWTGSATMLPMANGDKIPGIMYTGSTNESVQVQIVVFPTNASDELLLSWTKIPQNPVLTPPPFINYTDFRDPTTAWRGNDSLWTLTIGSCLRPTRTGVALLYQSDDFVSWKLLPDTFLHTVNDTGMWECVDFYPVAASGDSKGLDTSTQVGVKHVLKASMDETKLDFYTIGEYNSDTFTFTPDDTALDITFGFRYDYGRFYASKSFFDPLKQRRILFGWINESDTLQDDILKGWAGVQSIPRQVWFDNLTSNSLIQWPIEEITSLYNNSISIDNATLEVGSIMKIEGAQGAQWDITLSFAKPQLEYSVKDSSFDYSSEREIGCDQISGKSYHDGFFGPFGILVLSSEDLQEQTGVNFYLLPPQAGNKTSSHVSWSTLVCNDLSRSSLASNLDNGNHGGLVNVLEDEDELSLRILVDHSIVETFAQGGRTVITSRVYPTIALDASANLYLFNNASLQVSVTRFEAWSVSSIDLHYYSED
eukprot:c2525_g1_i1 orf=173-2248(+)